MLALTMEVLGWMGGVILIVAYALVSFGKLLARSPVFHWLNCVGSLMLAVNSAWHSAWPSVCVNMIWIGVGVAALLRNRPFRTT